MDVPEFFVLDCWLGNVNIVVCLHCLSCVSLVDMMVALLLWVRAPISRG